MLWFIIMMTHIPQMIAKISDEQVESALKSAYESTLKAAHDSVVDDNRKKPRLLYVD